MDKNSPEYLMLNEAYTNAVNQSNLAKDSIDEMKEASNETQAAADKVEEFAKKNEEAKKAIKKGENTVENEKIVEETKEEVLKQEGKTQDGLNKVEYSEIYAENMVKKANEMVDELEKLLEREKSKSSDSAITKSATTETTKNETKSASSKNGKEA